MSAAAAAKTEAEAAAQTPPAKGGKRRLLLLALPVVLAACGAGLWFGGILPPLLGMGKHEEAKPHETAADVEKARLPVFVEVPELVSNLNAGARKTGYVKLRARVELARAEDEVAVKAAMPRLTDLFQTYLREMRAEELRGSAGSYRLREELLGRANMAMAPVKIRDVLFTELLIQ